MARAYKDHVGTVLSNIIQTLLTFSAGLITGGSVVQNIQLTNTGGTDRVVNVWLIPSGQAAADQYLIFHDTVYANSTMAVPGGPWQGSSGAIVQAQQTVGADVIARVTAFEES